MVKDPIKSVSDKKIKNYFTILTCSATKLSLHFATELFGPPAIGKREQESYKERLKEQADRRDQVT